MYVLNEHTIFDYLNLNESMYMLLQLVQQEHTTEIAVLKLLLLMIKNLSF